MMLLGVCFTGGHSFGQGWPLFYCKRNFKQRETVKKEYVVNGDDYYAVLLEGNFDPNKNTLTITYQSDVPSAKEIKKYIKSEHPQLANKSVKDINAREGWFETNSGSVVGYIDVTFT